MCVYIYAIMWTKHCTIEVITAVLPETLVKVSITAELQRANRRNTCYTYNH